jgi:hypothetical protein
VFGKAIRNAIPILAGTAGESISQEYYNGTDVGINNLTAAHCGKLREMTPLAALDCGALVLLVRSRLVNLLFLFRSSGSRFWGERLLIGTSTIRALRQHVP